MENVYSFENVVVTYQSQIHYYIVVFFKLYYKLYYLLYLFLNMYKCLKLIS